MIGPMSPADSHAPEVGGKDDCRQEEKDASHFKPQDAAHAPEGTQKAAYAASDASAGGHGLSGRLSRRLGLGLLHGRR